MLLLETIVKAVQFFVAGPIIWVCFKVLHILQAWKSAQRPKSNYLQENFGPISDERFVKELELVSGEIPADLTGIFVRNGPNPSSTPKGMHHWFDGDGMLHAVRFKDGLASYSNTSLNSGQREAQRKFGPSIVLSLAEIASGSRVAFVKIALRAVAAAFGLVRPALELGSSNTAVVFHGKKLFALVENTFPLSVRILMAGLLQSGEYYNFGGKLTHSFTAHPKVDKTTGELIFFGYGFAPRVDYSVADRSGALVHSASIPLPAATMMHDFAITQRYSIVMDLPLVIDPVRALTKGLPMIYFKSTQASRFGIFPRHGDASSVMWFDALPCYIFHVCNAWEEELPAAADGSARGTEVVLIACRMPKIDFMLRETDNWAYLYEYRFNLQDGTTQERQLGERVVEFPRVNDRLMGRPTRFGYCVELGNGTLKAVSVVKYDLRSGEELATFFLGEGRFGGECIFVEREGARSEDDGYLMTFVYDSNLGTSEFVILDALSLEQGPVCVLRLPNRVPYGFHGAWVSEEQICSQEHLLQAGGEMEFKE